MSCIERGNPVVLAAPDGKIHQVAEQDKVKGFAGKKVTLTLTMKGATVPVDSIKAM